MGMPTCICADCMTTDICGWCPPTPIGGGGCLARFLVLTTGTACIVVGRSPPPLDKCGVHSRPRRKQRLQGASSSRLHLTWTQVRKGAGSARSQSQSVV